MNINYYVFQLISTKNSDFFPKQHTSINWFSETTRLAFSVRSEIYFYIYGQLKWMPIKLFVMLTFAFLSTWKIIRDCTACNYKAGSILNTGFRATERRISALHSDRWRRSFSSARSLVKGNTQCLLLQILILCQLSEMAKFVTFLTGSRKLTD